MKAVVQNTMFSILCLACIILAAPTQMMHLHSTLGTEPATEIKPVSFSAETPAVMDGAIRFACW